MGRLRKLIPRFSLRTLAFFLLLITSVAGLTRGWPAWTVGMQMKLQPFVVSAEFSDDSQDLCINRWATRTSSDALGAEESVWSVRAAKKISGRAIPSDPAQMDLGLLSVSPDGALAIEGTRPTPLNSYARDGGRGRALLFDAVSRRHLASLATDDVNVVSARFSPDGEKIVTATNLGDIRVWRRRRPEWWWGVFYLPEFWLTAAFAGLFVWSVVRDRRSLRKKGEPTE